MFTETYTLPSYWASYLINGDASGLEDDEIIEIDNFLANTPGYPANVSEEDDFTWFNDANHLGGNCAIYTFLIRD